MTSTQHKLTSDNGFDIINIDQEKSMFPNATLVVTPKGKLSIIVDTEILTHIPLEKAKIPSLMLVINFIAKDWGLNLSKSHDNTVMRRILVNSVKKN